MEHMPDLQTVYDALKCLYHGSDCVAKEKASKWLQDLQQSIFGWRIGDLLLQQNCDLESGYFGAQTLRTKIQSSFSELPIESHVSLRDSLIHHLKETNEKTNSVIVTQLCLALADLTLQMISWTNPIDDMLRIFNEDQGVNQRYLWPLLELLTVIPEEIQFSRHLKLGANRRSEVKLLMSKSSTNVLRFLETTLQTPLEDFITHHMRVLKCYKAWVGTQTAPVDIWGRSSVLVFAFDFLKSPQGGNRVHEAASDAVCALLEEQIECCNVPKHLSDFIVGKCKELRGAYSNAVVEEDSDRAMNYCRIFTFLCESQLYDIVGDNDVHQPERLDLVDILIACCEHPEYEVVEITFGFWYKLSEEIYQRNQDRLTEVFRRPIERLLQCLQKHAHIEPDHEGILDETDEFADFRRRIVDLVKDVAFIVGSTSVFRHCCLSLTGSSWEVTEAALFMMGAVARNLLPDENEVIPGVLQAILSLPHEAHICVRHTSLWLISEMPDWIDHHPEYLDSVLNFLLGHLTDPRLTGIASSAIESICNVARDRLTKHFDGLLQIIKNMDAFPLSLHASTNILKGVTTVLSRLPEDQIEVVLFEVCRPQVEPLKSLVNPTPNPEKGKPSDPAFWFDRLAAVFRHLNINTNGNSHPCQAVMIQIWPIFSEVLHRYESNQRICERLSRCLRFGLRSLGRFSSPVIGSIVKEITEVYARHQHSCFLYLGSILVDEYAGDKSCAQGFLTMLESFLGPAYALLQKENGLRDNPDTVDDLFRLCTRLLQRYPTELLSSPLFSYLLQCSLMASSLDHRDACSSVMKFISEVVQCARPKPSNGVTYNDEDSQRQELVRNVISSQGALILTTLLNASIFQLSSYNTVDVAEVIYSFASVDRENTKMLLTQTFATLPRTTPSGCVTATDEQMKAFLDKTVGATSSKDVTRALRDFIRLYR